MKVIEISKKYCKQYYNNDIQKCIQEFDEVIFDTTSYKTIGLNPLGIYEKSPLDMLKNYINNNRTYCFYYDLINKKFI